MPKKYFSLISILLVAFFATGCTKKTEQVQNQNINVNAVSVLNENVNTDTETDKDKLCGWVDESDVIIKVNFADGVVKDASYEVGFYSSPIISKMRVARSGCDYRTGFNYEELENDGAVQMGVRGYTDSVRRQIVGEPISVILGADGKPDIGSYIEVTIID
ncbi:MAG: hypothetical protein WCW66_05660 [Patescibacteria group bacterium]